MKKNVNSILLFLIFVLAANAQVPINVDIQILKAEDARRYDKTLEDPLRSSNAEVRKRAALAAGRIGREEAIPTLSTLLTNDSSDDVRAMAAFALGEIESIKAADAILTTLETRQTHDSVRARTVEAAGKIAAANPKDEKSKELGAAILKAVDFEDAKRSAPSTEIIRLGMTAILRAKPAGGEETVRKFLHYADPNIVADALNTLTRLRAKNANSEARELLKTHADPTVRANAARVLGAAEDKDALDLLLNAATTDKDSRVRVSAIRALGNLKDAKAADKLAEIAKKLFEVYEFPKDRARKNPTEKNELLEIATTLGRILQNINNEKAEIFLNELRQGDWFDSPETEIATARIAPSEYVESLSGIKENVFTDGSWRNDSVAFQGLGEIASASANLKNELARGKAKILLASAIQLWASEKNKDKFSGKASQSIPDLLRAYATFKSADTSNIIRPLLFEKDVFIRAAVAEILADQPKSKDNIDALKTIFVKAIITDKHDNDAQLAILDALFKLDKKESVGTLLSALNATDYLVRKKAFDLLSDKEILEAFSDRPPITRIPISIELALARNKHKDQVLPYDPKSRTKLGQVLNTGADYRRALARKNGSVKAVLRSEKGTFTIDFYPEQAPLTVDNFIKLARSKYFDGLEVHRVVPNFVMQDGDPRGDGNGGPGWSIRCEINMLPYERGAVGMALSGKDTGGSQWFVTHSPQPHLDGGYTVFGRVSETDMKVVEAIVRGDRVLTVRIIGR